MTAEPLIDLHDVAKVYGTGETAVYALRDIDLSIGRGEIVAITGPSGSGKSTLMNVLGCLDVPTSGQYWLSGVDVAALDEDALAHVRNTRLGFVFQSYNLLGQKTALENAALPLLYSGLPRAERLARAEAQLVRLGLGERLGHRPSELSGGQCQRVAIARALVTEPEILLADEPTGNLDSRTSLEILELVLGLRDELGATIIIVTHDPQIASRCERRVKVVDGKVAEDSGPVRREAA